jgi:transposase
MTRAYGRGPRGRRVVDSVPHGHWKTITFVGLLTARGFEAPLVIAGPMNGDLFVAYIRQHVVPALKPGDVLVMDNLTSHKRKEAREAIEAVGCRLLFLPPYSPDLNPIELAFSKLKALLRAAAKRTVAELERFIGQALDLFSPAECLNYMRHCGYNATQL